VKGDKLEISDRMVETLGVSRAYLLALLDRFGSDHQPFNILRVAGFLRQSRGQLRRDLRWLLEHEYIVDSVPVPLSNRPHFYLLTERGEELLAGEEVKRPGGATRPAGGRQCGGQQTALIVHDNQMNLGALDIQAHQHLSVLGIRADLRQSFRTAPDLIKRFTPAQVLMLHDPGGAIAANLALWRAAADAGVELEVRPALLWARIVEGQSPPSLPPAPKSIFGDLSPEQREAHKRRIEEIIQEGALEEE